MYTQKQNHAQKQTRKPGKNSSRKKPFLEYNIIQTHTGKKLAPLAQGLEHRPYTDLTQKNVPQGLCVASNKKFQLSWCLKLGGGPGFESRVEQLVTTDFIEKSVSSSDSYRILRRSFTENLRGFLELKTDGLQYTQEAALRRLSVRF